MRYRVELNRTHAPDRSSVVVEADDAQAALEQAITLARGGMVTWWVAAIDPKHREEIWVSGINREPEP